MHFSSMQIKKSFVILVLLFLNFNMRGQHLSSSYLEKNKTDYSILENKTNHSILNNHLDLEIGNKQENIHFNLNAKQEKESYSKDSFSFFSLQSTFNKIKAIKVPSISRMIRNAVFLHLFSNPTQAKDSLFLSEGKENLFLSEDKQVNLFNITNQFHNSAVVHRDLSEFISNRDQIAIANLSQELQTQGRELGTQKIQEQAIQLINQTIQDINFKQLCLIGYQCYTVIQKQNPSMSLLNLTYPVGMCVLKNYNNYYNPKRQLSGQNITFIMNNETQSLISGEDMETVVYLVGDSCPPFISQDISDKANINLTSQGFTACFNTINNTLQFSLNNLNSSMIVNLNNTQVSFSNPSPIFINSPGSILMNNTNSSNSSTNINNTNVSNHNTLPPKTSFPSSNSGIQPPSTNPLGGDFGGKFFSSQVNLSSYPLISNFNNSSIGFNVQYIDKGLNINFNFLQNHYIYKILYANALNAQQMQVDFQVGTSILYPGNEGLKIRVNNNPVSNNPINLVVNSPNSNNSKKVNISQQQILISDPAALTVQYVTFNSDLDVSNTTNLVLEFQETSNNSLPEFTLTQTGQTDLFKQVMLGTNADSIYGIPQGDISQDLSMAFRVKNSEDINNSPVSIQRMKQISPTSSILFSLQVLNKDRILMVESLRDLISQTTKVIGFNTIQNPNISDLMNQMFTEMTDLHNTDFPIGLENWVKDLSTSNNILVLGTMDWFKSTILNHYQNAYPEVVEQILQDAENPNAHNNQWKNSQLNYNPISCDIPNSISDNGVAISCNDGQTIFIIDDAVNLFKLITVLFLFWNYYTEVSALLSNNLIYKTLGLNHPDKVLTKFMIKSNAVTVLNNCSLNNVITSLATLFLSLFAYNNKSELIGVSVYSFTTTALYTFMILNKWNEQRKDPSNIIKNHSDISVMKYITEWVAKIPTMQNEEKSEKDFRKQVELLISQYPHDILDNQDEDGVNLQESMENVYLITLLFNLIEDIIPEKSKKIFIEQVFKGYINALSGITHKKQIHFCRHILIMDFFAGMPTNGFLEHLNMFPQFLVSINLKKKLDQYGNSIDTSSRDRIINASVNDFNYQSGPQFELQMDNNLLNNQESPSYQEYGFPLKKSKIPSQSQSLQVPNGKVNDFHMLIDHEDVILNTQNDKKTHIAAEPHSRNQSKDDLLNHYYLNMQYAPKITLALNQKNPIDMEIDAKIKNQLIEKFDLTKQISPIVSNGYNSFIVAFLNSIEEGETKEVFKAGIKEVFTSVEDFSIFLKKKGDVLKEIPITDNVQYADKLKKQHKKSERILDNILEEILMAVFCQNQSKILKENAKEKVQKTIASKIEKIIELYNSLVINYERELSCLQKHIIQSKMKNFNNKNVTPGFVYMSTVLAVTITTSAVSLANFYQKFGTGLIKIV